MQINKLALTGLASVAIVAATAAPALACDHKPAPKPVVHKTVVNHKDNDNKKDCDHKVVVKKVVEHKDTKKDCDHKPVVQPKPVVHKTDCDHKVQPKPVVKHDKDCDHKVVKPGKGGVTPTPSPSPQPQVLTASTQPMPTKLPQTGSEDLSLLLSLPLGAAGAGVYLRALRRK